VLLTTLRRCCIVFRGRGLCWTKRTSSPTEMRCNLERLLSSQARRGGPSQAHPYRTASKTFSRSLRSSAYSRSTNSRSWLLLPHVLALDALHHKNLKHVPFPPPCSLPQVFQRLVLVPLRDRDPTALVRIRRILRVFSLRRTKEQRLCGRPIVMLPTKTIVLKQLRLSKREQANILVSLYT
jgi:hypothetical protein